MNTFSLNSKKIIFFFQFYFLSRQSAETEETMGQKTKEKRW